MEHPHTHTHSHVHSDSCGCGCHEHTARAVSASDIIRLIIAIAALVLAKVLDVPEAWTILLCAAACVSAGYDVLISAVKNLIHGHIMDENFLMTIAAIGALAVGEGTEGATGLILFKIGEMLTASAESKARASVTNLMSLRAPFARVLRGGRYIECSPDDVVPGETLLVRPGELIALDGVIIKGSAHVDTSKMTGAKEPSKLCEGDEAIAGSINTDGTITIKVTREFKLSSVAKILSLLEEKQDKRASAQKFITRFARIYTPCVVIAALIIAFVPPLFLGFDLLSDFIYRALVLLVIACPCALVISIPLTFFCGIGGAARQGILIKGAHYVELLAKAKKFFYNKSGIIKRDELDNAGILSLGISENEAKSLFKENTEHSHRNPSAFVGAGAHDAASLISADVGIAIGSKDTDAATEAADIVILSGGVTELSHAIKRSRRTMHIVYENIFISLVLKALFLTLGALGLVGIWGAVFADVGVTLIAVANSLRAFGSIRKAK